MKVESSNLFTRSIKKAASQGGFFNWVIVVTLILYTSGCCIQASAPYLEWMLPTTIYHYTHEAGLRSILESQCLYATHFSDLNDALEVREILKHIRRYSRRPPSTRKRKEFCTFIEDHINELFISNTAMFAEFFVTCFTEDPDSSDLWYNETRNGLKQYALCFSRVELNNLTSSESSKWFGAENIDQVIYDDLDKLKVIQAWEREFNRVMYEDMHDSVARKSLERRTLCLPALFKSSTEWSQQKEWRIIIRKPTAKLDNTEGRIPQSVGLTANNRRYIELFNSPRVKGFNGLNNALTGLIVGSRGDENIARTILDQHGLSHIAIKAANPHQQPINK